MNKEFPFRRGKRFFNPNHKMYQPESISDTWEEFTLWMKEVFLWITGLKSDAEVKSVDSLAKTHEPGDPYPEVDAEKPKAQWINHSSFAISCYGINFLTDPIWSKRASPWQMVGPKRVHSPSLNLDSLPETDYVLISHDHYDHLDDPSVRAIERLHPGTPFIVPLGLKEWFDKRGLKSHELGWWDSIEFEKNGVEIKITCVPAQHFAGRNVFLLDHNYRLWCGYVVSLTQRNEPSKTFYFCGDTGYNPIDFKNIGRKLGPMDLSLLPIGAYLPRKILSTIHINPQEAIKIHNEVGSKFSIACHHATFALSQEPLEQPSHDLKAAMQAQHVSSSDFHIPRHGDWINW